MSIVYLLAVIGGLTVAATVYFGGRDLWRKYRGATKLP